MNNNLWLPMGYRRNPRNEAYVDTPTALVYQPHVYSFAARLVQMSGARHLIDLGCGGGGGKLSWMPSGITIHVCDLEPDEVRLRTQLPGAALEVQSCNFEQACPVFADDVLGDAVVVCADVIEHLRDPRPLLRNLAAMASQCRYMLLSTPARDRARGAGDMGPPANPAHCQEWTLDEFVRLAREEGLQVPLHGYTWNTDFHGWKSTILALDGREAVPRVSARADVPPPCAIVKAFNDSDFIAHSITTLRRQNVRVHLIDNWSTDGTFEQASMLAKHDNGVTVERFPEHSPAEFHWHSLLERTVEVAEAHGRGWYVHVESDEVRESPWPGMSLADSIAHVDACGYNAIDFTVPDFRYLAGEDVGDRPWETMRHFEFGRRPGHFQQVKAWKYAGQRVDLATSGGHDATFDGRRVYPLKFQLRHYPLRGPRHATRKIFSERLPRTVYERDARGWHVHYADVTPERLAGWKRHECVAWHPQTFHSEYLVERLSGIGIAD